MSEPLTRDMLVGKHEGAAQASAGPAWTAGPWRVDPVNGTWIWGPSEKGGETHIAEVRGWGYLTGRGHGALGLPEEEAIARQLAVARLISAAPDLYEALDYVLSAHGEQLTDAFDQARKALAKANPALLNPHGEKK